MFEYFNTVVYNERNIVDVYKTFDLGIDTEDYTYYTPTIGEDLMIISYNNYDTIDNWWVIFLFNDMYDTLFDIINDNTISSTNDYYINLIENYNSLETSNKKIVIELIRDYYLNLDYTLKEAVKATDVVVQDISNISDTLLEYISQYIKDTIVSDSILASKIKIPSSDVVYDIKNAFETLSVEWEANS